MVQADIEMEGRVSNSREEVDPLHWTAQLVANIDNKLTQAVRAGELKRLTLDNAKPEYKKILQQFVCPICTNVLDDFAACSDCEGLICRTCLNLWLARDTACPLCKTNFEEMKVSRQVMNVLNMIEFICPYDCGETFTYEGRKRHFDECSQCTEQKKCPFCEVMISQMPSGLAWHVHNDCEGPQLQCPDCSINVYQIYADLQWLQQSIGHECVRDLQRLVKLHKRKQQLEKFQFPFELDRQALQVIELHGFSSEEIGMFKDKAVQYFRTGPDLYQFANLIMKFCSDLGHGEHWFVTLRPKSIDQGGWLHRDANYRLKMEFKRNGEDYSFNIFKLL